MKITKPEDLKIGHYYTYHDDALYKIIDKGKDWVAFISYYFNDSIASVHIESQKDFLSDEVWEDLSDNTIELFNSLQFYDWDFLKIDEMEVLP